jgi:hypothetical protein
VDERERKKRKIVSRRRLCVIRIRVRLTGIYTCFIRFGSPILVLKPKSNRTGKILWF